MQVYIRAKNAIPSVKTISQEEFTIVQVFGLSLEKLFVYLLAILSLKGDVRNFRVTLSLAKSLKLKDFNNLLTNHFSGPQYVLCGHNAGNSIFRS
jgi:hypothetical protein